MWGGDRGPRHAPAVVSAVLAAGVLVALAIPALGHEHDAAGHRRLPQDLPVDADVRPLQEAFPGKANGGEVVIEDATSRGEGAAAIAELVATGGERQDVTSRPRSPRDDERRPGRPAERRRRDRREVEGRAGRASATSRPGDVGAVAAEVNVSGTPPQTEDLNDSMSACPSCSGSSWAWRSGCCW